MDLKPNLVSIWGRKRWRRKGEEKGRRRGRGREEEEEKKRSHDQKSMETNLDYGFYEIWYGSLVLYGYSLTSNLGFVRISS